MDVSPADDKDGGAAVAPASEEELEDEDVCRICRLPGEQGNPLRYPCACRGSIKFVHQECLLIWLNRRRTKKCEVCRHSYSFAPVYLENAPKRLTLQEFMIGLGTRVFHLVKPWVLFFLAWFVAIPLSTYWIIRLPLGREATDEIERHFMTKMSVPWIVSAFLLGECYCASIALLMVGITIVRASTVWVDGILAPLPADIIIENNERQGMAGVAQTMWRCMRILCDWWYELLGRRLREPHAAVVRNRLLHEFGATGRLLFILDDNAFVVIATNIFVSFLFVLLPFSIGQTILTLLRIFPPTTQMRANVLSNDTPVLAGYVILLTLVFSYFGSAIPRWLSMRFFFMALKLLSLLWNSFVSIRKSLTWITKRFITWVKCAIVLSMEFGALPWIYVTTMRGALFPIVARWFSVGLRFLTLKFPSLLWNSLLEVLKTLAGITKQFAAQIMVALVLSVKVGVLPMILGCWVDICTFPVLGGSITKRLEFLSEHPFLILLYWFMGVFYLGIALTYMDLVQQIVQKRALWFVQDVTDPDYSISELHLCHVLFALAFNGVLIVIVFHLPVKIITLICPSLFPLKFWGLTDNTRFNVAEIYSFNLLVKEVPKWLGHLTNPARVEPIVRKWFISVSSRLQLSDFLLAVPESNIVIPRHQKPMPTRPHSSDGIRIDQNVRPLLRQIRRPGKWLVVFAIAEGSMISLYAQQSAYTSEEKINRPRDSWFLLKISLLFVLAGLSLLLISTAFISLPVLVGRMFCSFIPSIVIPIAFKSNDFYTIWFGSLILQAIQNGICVAYDHIQRGRTVLLLNQFQMCMRDLLFFSIWVVVIPGLLGILIDLMVIIPLRVPIDETPVFFLIQDWLLGLVFLHIWTLLVILTENDCFATRACREKLRRISTVGINQLPTAWLLGEVLGSIIITLLMALCLPYVLVTLLPMLGCSTAVSSAVRRFIWPAFLAMILAVSGIRLTCDLIIRLHRLILEDRYLVGRRLCDFTEDGDNKNNA